MNPVSKTIGWPTHTWNPVTGCLHGCEYCYARKMANRFFDEWIDKYPLIIPLDNKFNSNPFWPCLWPNRLDQPARRKKPARIFVVSMGDLFGDFVPDEWIERVFKACEAAPQHTYYFLTKNPKRYLKVDYSLKWWLGFSAHDGESLIRRSLNMPEKVKRYVSIEPMTGEVPNIDCIEWIIVGAQTNPLKLPEREWVLDIRRQCKDRNVPLYEKGSLKKLDLPGGLIQQWPERNGGKWGRKQ